MKGYWLLVVFHGCLFFLGLLKYPLEPPNGIFAAAVLPPRVRGPWLADDVEFQAEFLEITGSVFACVM